MKGEKYKPKDLSIVIMTYNRPTELKRNFDHLAKLKSPPYEIIIVDQSENDKTKKLYEQYKKKIPSLKYTHSKKPSITKSKNIGLDKSSPKTKIILFLDDDAYVGPNYIDELIGAYNKIKSANAISGYDCTTAAEQLAGSGLTRIKNSVETTLKKMFFLGYVGDKEMRVTSPYGNTAPGPIKKPVRAQWFPGTDPSFKKDLLKQIRFDENFFWWSLGEDVDVGYRFHKMFGGMYLIPATMRHKHPQHEDDFKKKIKKIYMNQINHFYLYHKIMPEMKFRFFWNLAGITLLRTLRLFNITRPKKSYIEFKYYILSLIYSIRNSEKIKKGDLSIPFG